MYSLFELLPLMPRFTIEHVRQMSRYQFSDRYRRLQDAAERAGHCRCADRLRSRLAVSTASVRSARASGFRYGRPGRHPSMPHDPVEWPQRCGAAILSKLVHQPLRQLRRDRIPPNTRRNTIGAIRWSITCCGLGHGLAARACLLDQRQRFACGGLRRQSVSSPSLASAAAAFSSEVLHGLARCTISSRAQASRSPRSVPVSGSRAVGVEPVRRGFGQQARQVAPAAVDAGGADSRTFGHGRHRDALAALLGDQFFEGGAHLRLDLRAAATGALAGAEKGRTAFMCSTLTQRCLR